MWISQIPDSISERSLADRRARRPCRSLRAITPAAIGIAFETAAAPLKTIAADPKHHGGKIGFLALS